MPEKVTFENNEYDSFHEATCAALFNLYGWKWERPKHPIGQPENGRWLPDFLIKGTVDVYVECKGGLKWEDISSFRELTKYQAAVSGSEAQVLLIPSAPKRVQNPNNFPTSVVGILFDGELWSHAELGRWSGKIGFCHSANSWKDRITGEDVNTSFGHGPVPDIEMHWRFAESKVSRRRVSFFKGFSNSELQIWETSSED